MPDLGLTLPPTFAPTGAPASHPRVSSHSRLILGGAAAGDELGPELFDLGEVILTDNSGGSGEASIVGDELTLTSFEDFGASLSQAITFEFGELYRVAMTVLSAGTGGQQVSLGFSNGSALSVGAYSEDIEGGLGPDFEIVNNGFDETITITASSISVRKVL